MGGGDATHILEGERRLLRGAQIAEGERRLLRGSAGC